MSGSRNRKDITGLIASPEDLSSRVRLTWSPRGTGREEQTYPPTMDVYEKADSLVIELELPGVNKKDIEIFVASSLVTVQGIRSDVKHGSGPTGRKISFLQLERKLGRFYRKIELPVPCNTQGARAVYDKGILKIEFTKIVDRRGGRKRIPVE